MTAADIIASVAAEWCIDSDVLRSPLWSKRLTHARRQAYALLRRERKLSFHQIGMLFSRDRSAIRHAISRTA